MKELDIKLEYNTLKIYYKIRLFLKYDTNFWVYKIDIE